MARDIYRLIRQIIKVEDPFKDIKRCSNRVAMKIYERLKKRVEEAEDGLLTAVELAIAGNIIDYGVRQSLDIEKEVERILSIENSLIQKEKRAIFNYSEFRDEIEGAESILYLADNAGETVFDRVLIEEIRKIYGHMKIIYVVKEKPIINDALTEDAMECGIDKTASIMSSGLDTPGTILSLCSQRFRRLFEEAHIVISKGQGNFEALSDAGRRIFFLFMAKCPVVAKDIGCNVGDVILLYR